MQVFLASSRWFIWLHVVINSLLQLTSRRTSVSSVCHHLTYWLITFTVCSPSSCLACVNSQPPFSNFFLLPIPVSSLFFCLLAILTSCVRKLASVFSLHPRCRLSAAIPFLPHLNNSRLLSLSLPVFQERCRVNPKRSPSLLIPLLILIVCTFLSLTHTLETWKLSAAARGPVSGCWAFFYSLSSACFHRSTLPLISAP